MDWSKKVVMVGWDGWIVVKLELDPSRKLQISFDLSGLSYDVAAGEPQRIRKGGFKRTINDGAKRKIIPKNSSTKFTS